MSIIQEALKKAEMLRGNSGLDARVNMVRQDEAKSFIRAADRPSVENVPVYRKSIYSAKEGNKTMLSIVLLSSFIVFIVVISLFSGRPSNRRADIPIKSEMPLRAEAYSKAPIVPTQLIEGKTNIQQPSLALNGIMYLEDSPRAIINDVLVEEGDMVQGALVRKIYEKSVTLESKDAEITLKLK